MTAADVLEGRARWSLLQGSNLEHLPSLPADSVDAIVTDPPYELGFMGKAWDGSGIAYSVELWREVLRVLKPGGHLLAFGGTRTYHRMACAIEDAGFEVRDSLHWIYGTGFPKSLNVSKALDEAAGATREVVGRDSNFGRTKLVDGKNGFGDYAGQWDVTAPATDLAKQWNGWGTALKPAHEPIIMARKPLVGTVAANVTQHGTGALNIDGCRIGTSKDVPASAARDRIGQVAKGDERGRTMNTDGFNPSVGRWPANVIFDEAAAAELDAQSGTSKSTGGQTNNTFRNSNEIFGTGKDDVRKVNPGKGDSGGASRFFYVAKPDRGERDSGCDYLPRKTGAQATDREDGTAGLDSPRTGAGRTGGAKTSPNS